MDWRKFAHSIHPFNLEKNWNNVDQGENLMWAYTCSTDLSENWTEGILGRAILGDPASSPHLSLCVCVCVHFYSFRRSGSNDQEFVPTWWNFQLLSANIITFCIKYLHNLLFPFTVGKSLYLVWEKPITSQWVSYTIYTYMDMYMYIHIHSSICDSFIPLWWICMIFL